MRDHFFLNFKTDFHILYVLVFVLLIFSCGKDSKTSNTDESLDNSEVNSKISDEVSQENNVQDEVNPRKIALLVGIDKYEIANNLEGCVNDVDLMESLLVKKFGFDTTNIRKLVNKNATRDGIIDTFKKHLVSAAKPGDIIVFHYSGHGAQVRNLGKTNHDEPDQLEEILVPYDFEDKPNLPFKGISDDEINGLLKLLTDITENVTFIFDACHSAGTTKSLDRVRKVKVRPRVLPNPADFAINSRSFRNNEAKYTFIAGCKSDQFSFEMGMAPNGKPQGALTYYLVDELFKRNGRVSYADIISNIRNNVKAKYPDQYPELLGTSNDKQVFGIENLLPVKHVKIYEIKDDKVKIDAGAILGLTKGSEFEVYEPTEDLRSQSRRSIARIKITQVDAYSSIAQIINGNISAINSQAVEVIHNYEDLIINIFYDGDWGDLTELKNEINALQYINHVNVKNDADILLKKVNGSLEFFLGFDLSFPKEKFTNIQNHDSILLEIEKWASWFSAILINNPDSELSIEVSMEAAGEPEGTKGVSDALTNSDYKFKENQRIHLHVKNKNTFPIYIHLLDIVDDGNIYPLCLDDFPAIGVDQVLAGESVTIPLDTKLSNDRDTKDVIKVIASTTGEIDLNYISLGCYHNQDANKKNVIPPKNSSSNINTWAVVNKVIEVIK
ncbi:caspase family protein [Winogradskyella flava]|uniref:caspase family protein n=1 Tax=Winogradskyella flava TaxID=1884876 RepID=UPI002490A761|nr:caspase family protein [Winogradskyella flava]